MANFAYTPTWVTGNPALARQWAAADINGRIAIAQYVLHGQDPQWDQDLIVRDWVQAQYGAMAAYLNDPVIGPILMQAGREGWTPERIQSTLQQTAWWRTTTDAQRKYDLLTKTDPSTAAQQVAQNKVSITQIAQQEGIFNQYSDAQLTTLATNIARNGITDANQIKAQVLAQAAYNPSHPVGQLGATLNQVQQRAQAYLTPLSDQQAWQYAKDIESGQNTIDGVQSAFQTAASSRFPWMQQALQAGQTVKQVIDPYITQTAQLLDKSPDQIDPLGTQFLPILDHVPDGQQDHRMMTLSEAAQYVRSTPDYDNTTKAKQDAATLSQTLLKTFGKVAA